MVPQRWEELTPLPRPLPGMGRVLDLRVWIVRLAGFPVPVRAGEELALFGGERRIVAADSCLRPVGTLTSGIAIPLAGDLARGRLRASCLVLDRGYPDDAAVAVPLRLLVYRESVSELGRMGSELRVPHLPAPPDPELVWWASLALVVADVYGTAPRPLPGAPLRVLPPRPALLPPGVQGAAPVLVADREGTVLGAVVGDPLGILAECRSRKGVQLTGTALGWAPELGPGLFPAAIHVWSRARARASAA